MVFWGIEVKPGKPFTHEVGEAKGRLHVSMASLGLGNATAKSVLQCNVGNKSPVLLCSLYPRTSESLQLNLEFEEVDDVIFSVIGPRSIHLSGYYVAGSRSEESESYGEDIADTESERSDRSDEDDYEDSFINDGEIEVVPPSPLSNEDKKPRDRKINSKKRLIKAFELSDSADEQSSEPKQIANGSSAAVVLVGDNEDNCLISSDWANAEKDIQNGGEFDVNLMHYTSTITENDVGNITAELKSNTDDCATDGMLMRESDMPVDPLTTSKEGREDEATPRKRKRKVDVNAENEHLPKITDDREVAHKNDETPKKKKRKNDKKGFDDCSLIDVKEIVDEQDAAIAEQECEGNKDKKKKKKKSDKTVESEDMAVEKNDMDAGSKMSDATFQYFENGLVIEQLEPGKPNGKVAVSGKKVSVCYVGKLKETGEIIDSNVGNDLFKFRLGAKKVIEAWDIGLEGMRVGEKRRLIVPPLLGYGSEGDDKLIPPDSWLIYEVELVKVR